ncbi:MAG TPA: molybdopterin-dependent oxidoreductase [Bryobacteraceae bacterium]|nr:molybdopterin-dependent oxidoreductase [Bryobacteraceae bacterium]
MQEPDQRLDEHRELTRRFFFGLGPAAAAAWSASSLASAETPQYLTPPAGIYILDKGKAGVAKLPPEKLREIGLVPETWSLEVVPDPASDSAVERPLSRARGNALDWKGLMQLAEEHAVRYLHVCVCTNGADPYHMTLWEGVPLREIIQLAGPQANIRRVYYQSQAGGNLPPFQASLSLSQIMETPPGQMPVILAYMMNGQLIPASIGGPVRMVVPGAYGSKLIKWVRRVVLTNDHRLNDSDAADFNNDTESPLKTRARFINAPKEAQADKPIVLTGMAQVGISGLSKVQYAVCSQAQPWPADDPHYTKAEWKEAAILPPPTDWGGGLAGGKLPAPTGYFDPAKGAPVEWPMRFTTVHWAALLPGLPAGGYGLCCRTIDANGFAQPLPRLPLARTGVNAIHRVALAVKA